MKTLLHKLGKKVKGVFEGFDRIIFKGRLKPLCYPGGFSSFLNERGVLNKSNIYSTHPRYAKKKGSRQN